MVAVCHATGRRQPFGDRLRLRGMTRFALLVGAGVLTLSACGTANQPTMDATTGDPQPSTAGLGPVTLCRDVLPIPPDVELDTTLDFEGGHLAWSYLDPGPGQESRSFVVDFVNDESCRERDDTFELINHALEAGEHPALTR